VIQLLKVLVEKGGAKFFRAYGRQNSKSGPVSTIVTILLLYLLSFFSGSYILVWKKGLAVLTAGPVKVTPDPRFSLVKGYDLHIADVTPQDAGTYTCQIGTLVPKELSHNVEVLGKLFFLPKKNCFRPKSDYNIG